MAKFFLNVSRKTIISLIPPLKENKKGKGKLRLYSIVGKVLSDERLGAKLRVTENRCVLFDSFTYIYPALLPQHWALYAKVDSTPFLYIYILIYIYIYIDRYRYIYIKLYVVLRSTKQLITQTFKAYVLILASHLSSSSIHRVLLC